MFKETCGVHDSDLLFCAATRTKTGRWAGGIKMNMDLVPIGENPPYDVNVIIEIPLGGNPVKYEFDKKSGAIYVDRFLHTAMYYPTNYGFVPHTLSDDGDPIDAAVLGQLPVIPGCVIKCRPIGVLIMEDESGIDEKILCVPVDELHPYYGDISSYRDLRPVLIEQIQHFFEHYKDLEHNKWVKVQRWGETEEAMGLIREAIERAENATKADKAKAAQDHNEELRDLGADPDRV